MEKNWGDTPSATLKITNMDVIKNLDVSNVQKYVIFYIVFLRIFKFKILLAGSTTESTCW